MANTYVDYTGDGNETSFAYTFAVLAGQQENHIIVEVDDSTTTGGKFEVVDSADYTIDASAGTITFDTAPESGARIRIKRDSDASTLLVDFKNGTVLPERDLDLAYLHNLFLNEETEEGSGKNSLVKDANGNYDADSVKLVNLADPENAQDAVTKGYADGRYVDEAGDTMTGSLAMSNNNITGVNTVSGLATPTADDHAANKKYVDDEVADEASARAANDALQVTKAGDSMSGNLTMTSPAKVIQNQAPTGGDDLTNKTYVDAQISSAISTGTPGGQIQTANIADDAVTAAKLEHTAVSPGSYTNADITVDENGRITAASSGTAGGEDNVQADWNETDNTSDAFILNKPTIPTNNNQLTNGAGYITDSDVASNSAVQENTAKVTNATHTGDVTGSTALTIANNAVTTAKIASGAVTATQIQVNAVGQAAMQNDSIGTNELINNAVTFAKMQNINTAKVIGKTTAGSGDPEEVSILDDDTMATASATTLATSESIKAYVDAQVVSVSKYDSGWFNDSGTGLTNAGTYSFTHNLGTSAAQVQVWMATSSAGADPKQVTPDFQLAANATDFRGAAITDITNTTLTVQMAEHGWCYLNTSGVRVLGNWGTTYTHIKVIVIG